MPFFVRWVTGGAWGSLKNKDLFICSFTTPIQPALNAGQLAIQSSVQYLTAKNCLFFILMGDLAVSPSPPDFN